MVRWILAVLLATMALGQLSDPSGFVDIVGTYGVGGTASAWMLSSSLIAGEVAGAIALVHPTDRVRRRGARVALVVAAAWSALAFQAFARGLVVPNCGCFGVHLGQELRWWILLEDAEFMAIAWMVVRQQREAAQSLEAVTST